MRFNGYDVTGRIDYAIGAMNKIVNNTFGPPDALALKSFGVLGV